jgi:NTE family protein
VTPVDLNKIGISYSGGGPLLAVELGIARAFVQSNIRPAIISGASAGAIAGAAHAIDMYTGRGIDLAVEQLGRMTNATLQLDPGHFVVRLLRERTNLKSIGDNTRAGQLVGNVLNQLLQLQDLTLAAFGQPLGTNPAPSPQLQVVATDLVSQDAYWFPGVASLREALIASSAIPAVFPWRTRATPTGTLYLVDGGVVENQPLQSLMDQGCGRIYACSVGAGPLRTEPANLIDNLIRSFNVAMHSSSKVEEAYLRSQMPAGGRVIHIHPEVTTPLPDFNFTPELVNHVVDEACQLTLKWLAGDPVT